MRNKSLFLFFAFCLISGIKYPNICLKAAIVEPDSIIVKKCSDFMITGDGASNQWKISSWINIAQQEGNTSSYKTKTKVLYSETGIYFLFNCEDQKLTSTMKADNLNLYEEDVVEVFLWPDENFPVYFEYELSPFNFELPIIVPNKKGNFLGWLPWHYDGDRRTQHATSIIGGTKERGSVVSGWIAEFFIPYKLLNPLVQGAPNPGNHWRANMYRIDYDNGMVPFAWQKTTKTFHEYNKFGTFIFK
jgi:Carbohydrate family 9 binding domain-like